MKNNKNKEKFEESYFFSFNWWKYIFKTFKTKTFKTFKFWLFIFLLICGGISLYIGLNWSKWELQKWDKKLKKYYLQTAANFDKTILTYDYDNKNKTLKLSLKEIRDAFKKEFLKKERLQKELDFYKKNWKNEEYSFKNWKEEDIEWSDNNKQKWTVEKDWKTNRYEHLLLFSVDKNKNIKKIFETTNNLQGHVSTDKDLIGLFNEEYNKNKEIVGFFKVHNHPNGGENFFSSNDKKTEKWLKNEFKKKFSNNLFFDNFVHFQWHNLGGDNKHYLNNIDDIFNKEIIVKCC